jgi:hypothetical protein
MISQRLLTLALAAVVALILVFSLAAGIHSAKGEQADRAVPGIASIAQGLALVPSSDTVGWSQTSVITFTPAVTIYLPLMLNDYRDCLGLTRVEADYISACQYISPGHPAHGAINNVCGQPTWVVPSENAMAILGLIMALDILGDPSYWSRAQLAADYLIRIQASDGAWYDQYDYTTPVDLKRSPRQTAEVMIALYKLGYAHNRYQAMTHSAKYLIDCQDVGNKTGNDDGLLGGGKDAQGQYRSWRWTHDNAYAYWALKAAEAWAIQESDVYSATLYASGAQRILEGINTYLYDPSTGVWHIAIDANGNPQWISHLENLPSWIQYAPQMLDLPANGVNSPQVGEWIHAAYQQSDGSCIGYAWEDNELKIRKYPGLSFQAALSWFDTTYVAYVNAAIDWAITSGLWQTIPDADGVTGGWIDWIEVAPSPGRQADQWQRFIDTSFYAIASCNGGCDFRIP